LHGASLHTSAAAPPRPPLRRRRRACSSSARASSACSPIRYVRAHHVAFSRPVGWTLCRARHESSHRRAHACLPAGRGEHCAGQQRLRGASAHGAPLEIGAVPRALHAGTGAGSVGTATRPALPRPAAGDAAAPELGGHARAAARRTGRGGAALERRRPRRLRGLLHRRVRAVRPPPPTSDRSLSRPRSRFPLRPAPLPLRPPALPMRLRPHTRIRRVSGSAVVRVRVEITGSQKCRIVEKSQSVVMMITPIIVTRTRI
jgi:hypothetical protein